MKTTKIILCIMISASFTCNDLAKKVELGEKERISANIVNNPITAREVKQSGLLPELTFDKLRYNFGKITQGESVSYQFSFTNTGEGDLIINNAKGSCGCTVPEWPRQPLSPGEEGNIKVTFNSNGREGKQKKTVTLVTNAVPNTTVLTITGQVVVSETQIQK